MILQLMGSGLLTAGGGLAGMLFAGRLTRRAEALAGFTEAAALMKAEIAMLSTPMENLLDTLAEEPGCASVFFQRVSQRWKSNPLSALSDCWDQAAAEIAPSLAIRKEDMADIRAMGRSLGRYDRDTQLRELSRAEERFRKRLAEAEDKKARLCGVYRFAGFAAGITVALVLI